MRHATQDDLDRLEPLLAELRNLPGLRERKRGYFSRKSRAFLHFHEDAGDFYVDVKLDGKFQRMFSIDIPPVPGTHAVNGATPTGERLKAVIGQPNSLCIPPSGNVMFVGESTFPGRIFKISLDGKVLGVIGKSGRNLKQFSGAHALACPSETEIYAAETSNWRVQKLILHTK